MTRQDALRLIIQEFPREPIIVTLGQTVRELVALGRSDNHLYVLDSMGLPPAIGLGLSLSPAAQKFDKTVVIEGDGSLLMGLSTLATVGALQPERYLLVVLDNGAYASTGGQPTAAPVIDFCRIAEACRMAARQVQDEEGLREALRWGRAVRQPALIRAYIDNTNVSTPYFLEDPVGLAERFQRYLEQA